MENWATVTQTTNLHPHLQAALVRDARPWRSLLDITTPVLSWTTATSRVGGAGWRHSAAVLARDARPWRSLPEMNTPALFSITVVCHVGGKGWMANLVTGDGAMNTTHP